jgi:hypothetical protein
MSEWWTYSLSDFLLFSPRTYRRLFELFNADTWPMHGLALAAGGVVAWAAWRGRLRLAALLLAVVWAWVAWAFFLRHYASINWAAPALAAAFGVQAALLAVLAAWPAAPPSRPRAGAMALLAFGLLLQPIIGPLLLGRPWTQIELFGMAPDPTATVTLGLLSMGPATRWQLPLWPIPLAWCAVSAATLWTMRDVDAWILPAVAAVAIAVALRGRGSL